MNRIPASEATSRANLISRKENSTPTLCPPKMISASSLPKTTTSLSQNSLKSGLPSSRRAQPRGLMWPRGLVWPNSRLICDTSVSFTACTTLRIEDGLRGMNNASSRLPKPTLMNEHPSSISHIFNLSNKRSLHLLAVEPLVAEGTVPLD